MSTLARAQTPDPETSESGETSGSVWNGFVQAAYHAEVLGSRGRREQLPALNQYTPAGNHFVLHAAQLALTHAFSDEVSATVKVNAGYDAPRTASYPFKDGLVDVPEAYATYKRGPWSITAGKFSSYMGIEYIEGPLNANITRGYSYNLAEPNTHTGFKVHYTQGALDVGLGLVNGWDTLLDNNGDKTVIWRIGLTPSETFTLNFNGTFGSETEGNSKPKRLALDLDGEWTLTEHLLLRFQANTGWDRIGTAGPLVNWWVIGVQPLYKDEIITLGARAEVFVDPDGARAQLGNTKLVNVVVTPGVVVNKALHARLEARSDFATRTVFGKPSDPRSMLLSLAVAAEYVF